METKSLHMSRTLAGGRFPFMAIFNDLITVFVDEDRLGKLTNPTNYYTNGEVDQ